MGVRRAVETALDAPNKLPQPIYTFGPLIHNPQVLDLLKERGISSIEEVPDKGDGTVLIRAHGVPPSTKKNLEKAGFTVIDATCPRVIKVQTIIDRHARQGYSVIIIGDKKHPEVMGLMGYTQGKGHVAKSIEELDALPSFENAIIVAQTTQNTQFFSDVKAWAQQHHPHYEVFDTICGSTENRQAEIRELSEYVDAVVVVGGKNSGNTRRLAAIAKESGKPVYHVESESELDLDALSSVSTIGLTAGASTPNWIIKRVLNTLSALPISKKKSLQHAFNTIQKALLLTNVCEALGAGGLCYAASTLQGIQHYVTVMVISMLYVLNMHIVNNLTGNKANQYNDPDKAAFYNVHKASLIWLSIMASCLYLIISFFMGMLPFVIILCMSVLGVFYNFKFFPKALFLKKPLRIRDIPGSKTLFVAFAWGVVTCVFPVIADKGTILTTITLFAFIWVTCLVFARTAFYDILDMQGDRIVGKETIPILVGEAKAKTILKSTLYLSSALLFGASFFKWLPSLGYYLLICPAGMLAVLEMHQRDFVIPGIRWEFIVEVLFIIAGVITLLWSVAV